MKHKLYRRVGIIVASLFLLAGLCIGYYFLFLHPYRGTVSSFAPALALDATLTRAEAEEDLQYLFDRVKSRHPAWLDGSTALTQAVGTQYQRELSALGDANTVRSIWQAASRITAQLHDGHTRVRWYNPDGERYLSEAFSLERDGEPVSIDGVPTADLLRTYLRMASYELEFYASAQFFSRVLLGEALLQFCGVDTSDGVDMAFHTEQGVITRHYSFVPEDQRPGVQSDRDTDKWVDYSIDRERNLAVFTLKSCDVNAVYASTLDSFFSQVRSNGISNIAVDLRGNVGGDSRVANEFLQYIDVDSYTSLRNAVRFGWILWRNTGEVAVNHKKPATFGGSIYVLTDSDTYSSAMDFAMLVKDNQLGVIVGGTSGNLPDSYGDILCFQLPHSGIAMTVSYKRWFRIDATKSGQPLTPDYEVPADEALNRVHQLIEEKG